MFGDQGHAAGSAGARGGKSCRQSSCLSGSCKLLGGSEAHSMVLLGRYLDRQIHPLIANCTEEVWQDCERMSQHCWQAFTSYSCINHHRPTWDDRRSQGM